VELVKKGERAGRGIGVITVHGREKKKREEEIVLVMGKKQCQEPHRSEVNKGSGRNEGNSGDTG